MTQNKLLKDTKKLIKETNRRLARLNKGVDINRGRYNPKTKRFERKDTIILIDNTGKRKRIKVVKRVRYPVGTWATKKLTSRLEDYMKGGKVVIPNNVTDTKLVAINKALRLFLNSQTSTISGIQAVEKQTKQNISNVLSYYDEDLNELYEPTNKHIEKMYDLFGTEDMDTITDYIGPSDFFAILNESIKANDDNVRYLNKVRSILDDPAKLNRDDDFAEALVRVFNYQKSL